MNELLPIIRRKRRPLLETNQEMPKAETRNAVEAVENLQPPTPHIEPPTQTEPSLTAAAPQAKLSDAKVTSKRKAR